MKVVVGLGNPGEKYAGTRHNVGFDVICELAKRWSADRPRRRFEAECSDAMIAGEKVLLVQPQTYMNVSGRSVGPLVKYHQLPLTDVLVVCDDLNLPLAQLRLRASGSAGGQKGLLSILQVMGTEDVPRLRLGIDRPPPGQDASNYVLAKFPKAEVELVDDAVRWAASAVELWISRGLEAAMNVANAAEKTDPPPAKRNPQKPTESTSQ
ncbi:MAG TPA: aminoacyl-tRNA hydrolase [Planctomycetaceae bacterium]|nr:aminoacyl-tRNA hydrolase [Planctomycetaceae bacterium]